MKNNKTVLAVVIMAGLVVASGAMAQGKPTTTPNSNIYAERAQIRAEHQAQIQAMLEQFKSATSSAAKLQALRERVRTKMVTLRNASSTIAVVKPGQGGWKLGLIKQGKNLTRCVKVPPGHLVAPGFIKVKVGQRIMSLPNCQKMPRGIQNRLNATSSPATDLPATTTASTT